MIDVQLYTYDCTTIHSLIILSLFNTKSILYKAYFIQSLHFFQKKMRSLSKMKNDFYGKKVYSEGPRHKHQDGAKHPHPRKKDIPAGAVAGLAGVSSWGSCDGTAPQGL